jgi:hypothetical protein
LCSCSINWANLLGKVVLLNSTPYLSAVELTKSNRELSSRLTVL